jgi:uncharacterized RDD family membrane protein YckC
MAPVFLIDPDGQTSEHSEVEIVRRLHDGSLNQNRFFWREGMSEWRRLSEFKAALGPALVPPRRAGTASLPWPVTRDTDTRPQVTAQSAGTPPAHRALPAEDESRLGHFRLRRLGAILFDNALLFLVPAGFIELFPRERLMPGKLEDDVLTAVGCYCLLIYVTQIVLSFRGQTVGKRIFGLRAISRSNWQIAGVPATMARLFTHGALALAPFAVVALLPFFPALFYAVCAYAVFDGLLILFDDRCLHDYCGGTVVVSDHHL